MALNSKAVIGATAAKARLVRDPLVGPARSERVVWIWHLISHFNGRSGTIRCVAKSVPPQLQTNAAPATWPNVNVGEVRSLPVHSRCSERRLILDLSFVDHAAKVVEESFAAELVQCSQCQLSLAFCFICLNAEILSLVVVSAATMPLNTTMFSRFCPFFGKLNE